MSEPVFSCSDCCAEGYDRHYASIAALSKHQLKWHEDDVVHRKSPMETPHACPICSVIYSGNTTMVKIHYEEDHNIDLKKYEKVFHSMEDFDEWKSDLEARTGSEFIKRRKMYITVHGTEKLDLVCSRDGIYKSRSTGRRSSKVLGSKKINAHCPAGMKLSKSVEGIIRVNVIETHVGHSVELAQFALTRAEREEIARKIESKVPFATILKEFRKSGAAGDRLRRINLLRRQDLYNIKKEFALFEKSVKNTEESWVEKINVSGPVVRYYKPQGKAAMDEYGLQSEDLVLVFFNNSQLDILKKFSDKCICLDRVSTSLAAISVVDDFNQGFPAAFLISNRIDSTVLKLFFKTVKAAVGCPIITDFFMCGVDEAYHNIWSEVMGPAERVLYCSWLVDSDWKSHLVTIKDKPKQDEVYRVLKKIAVEEDEDNFNIVFEEVCRWLVDDEDTLEFGKYFIEKYGCSASQWAYCCRKTLAMHSKMQLERVHKTLEHIYSGMKTTEELYKAVQDLMRFPRDRLYDRLIRHEVVSSTLKQWEKLHNRVDLLIGCEVALERNNWVLSWPNSSKVVRISKHNVLCDCMGKCPVCGGCSHMFLCSCLDSLVRWKMCEHIHYLCKYVTDNSEGAPMVDAHKLEQVPLDEVSQASCYSDEEEICSGFSYMSSQEEYVKPENAGQAANSKENLHKYKQRVNEMLKAVMDCVNQAEGVEEVQMYEGLIKPVLTSLEARGCIKRSSRPLTTETLSNSARRKRKLSTDTNKCTFDDSSKILVGQNGESDNEPELLIGKKAEPAEIVFESDEEFNYAEEITVI
uniref:DNA mismatch repair protein MutS n=2 Tax=Lygus hesperus TaxID=30085 RepID=A0A0A9XRR4_LYGHE